MTSTTLPSKSFAPAAPQAIGEALRALSIAFQGLVLAVSASLGRATVQAGPAGPAEEAERVRDIASTYLQSDPGFAADLFAAADRHERGSAA